MKWVVPHNSSLRANGFFEDFDRFFDSFLAQNGDSTGFRAACDIDETEKHYLVSFDLPGVKKEDIHIEVKDNHLIVTGERRKEINDAKAQKFERSYGKFQRAFSLPEKVDAKGVEAHFEDGVLQLAVPKSTESLSHKVEIGSNKSGGLFSKILDKKD